MVAACKVYYQDDAALKSRMTRLLSELTVEFGEQAERFAEVAGPYVLEKIRSEEKRLNEGLTYEPPTFYEKNEAGAKVDRAGSASCCRYVTPAMAAGPPLAAETGCVR